MDKLEPLGQNILIKALVDDKTESGLVIPDQEEKSDYGEVISRGDVVSKRIDIGDKVILKKHSGNFVLWNKQKYYVCEEKDIILKIT